MQVRFTAQWLSPNGWLPLNGAATSPWQSAGSAEYTWGQAGWTYSLSVPAGKSYQLRVVAEMQWAGSGRSATHVTGPCNVSG
jgi:neutral trehalase